MIRLCGVADASRQGPRLRRALARTLVLALAIIVPVVAAGDDGTIYVSCDRDNSLLAFRPRRSTRVRTPIAAPGYGG